MAQLFPPSANALARASIAGAIVTIGFTAWALASLAHSSYVTGEDVIRDQPVPFSHQHHVAGLGIDCRYCHTAVEEQPYAGIPPTGTCMNCHSQIFTQAPVLEPVRQSWRTGESIPWVRVHDLPDYVYFNHSIHVQKGVGCVTCHGRVDRMQLTYQPHALFMQWCLECHENPERYVRPREAVYDLDWRPPPEGQLALGKRLVEEYRISNPLSCSVCHR